MHASVGAARYCKKVKNGYSIPLDNEIKRFCGFPIGVITLPIVMPNAKVIKSGADFTLICFAIPKTIGVATSATVSFIKNADNTQELTK